MSKKEVYNSDFYSTKNAFKILAFTNDSCNYKCSYCYNTLPRTNVSLDLHKLYEFIDQVIIDKYKKPQLLWIELIGGEPTLNPDLEWFCSQFKDKQNVKLTIFTNFSKPVSYYKKLLSFNNVYLILSYHCNQQSLDFYDKICQFSEKEISKKITVSIIYEHEHINKSLEMFDLISKTFPNIYELNFPLIDNNENYFEHVYSKNDMSEYNKRHSSVIDKTNIKIVYKDKTSEIVNQHYFITNEENKAFKHWLCNVGLDFLFVYFNGDICLCDGYRDKPIGNVNSLEYDKFQLPKKPVFCNVDYCPCVFDIKKTKMF